MQKSLLIGAVLLLMLGCSEKNEEAPSTQTPLNESAQDKAFNQSFVQSCVDTATRNSAGGLNASAADKICQCSLAKFKKKYSVADVTALMQSGTDAQKMEFAQFSVKVGTECAGQWKAGEL